MNDFYNQTHPKTGKNGSEPSSVHCRGLLDHHVEGDDQLPWSALLGGGHRAGDVLQPSGRVGVGGIGDGERLGAVVLVAMEHHDAALLGLARMHDTQVKAVGGEAQVVAHGDGIALHERFLTQDTVARHGQAHALALLAIDQRPGDVELPSPALRVKPQDDAGGVARLHLAEGTCRRPAF